MPYSLNNVFPWGRSYDEYIEMFCLTEKDFKAGTILGCADGPASFNVEATQKGFNVISCDPLYQYSTDEIQNRIYESSDKIMQQVLDNVDDFIWGKRFANPQHLKRHRLATMQAFLKDFQCDGTRKRYIAAALPKLPFSDKQFNLALVSHFLFLYAENLDLGFHKDSIEELCRVAWEVRIFPLKSTRLEKPKFFDELIDYLLIKGYKVKIVKHGYEFIKGANEMLQVYA